MALLVGGAALVPGAPERSVPAAVIGDRATALGLPTTGATLLWMRALPRFGAGPTPDEIPLLAADLGTCVSLDPSFDDAWLGGTLMLRVVGGPARDLSVRGRTLRPELPWALIDPEAP